MTEQDPREGPDLDRASEAMDETEASADAAPEGASDESRPDTGEESDAVTDPDPAQADPESSASADA